MILIIPGKSWSSFSLWSFSLTVTYLLLLKSIHSPNQLCGFKATCETGPELRSHTLLLHGSMFVQTNCDLTGGEWVEIELFNQYNDTCSHLRSASGGGKSLQEIYSDQPTTCTPGLAWKYHLA